MGGSCIQHNAIISLGNLKLESQSACFTPTAIGARAHATKFNHKRNGSTNQLPGFRCFRLENVLQLAHVACCTTRIFDRALGLQSLCRVTV